MKILLFAESVRNSAGIERMTVSLANELVKLGYEIDLVVCDEVVNSFYAINEAINIHTLGAGFKQRWKAIRKFRQIVRKLHPDVIVNVAIPMGQISLPALILYKQAPPVVAWEHFHLYAGSRIGYVFRILSAIVCRKTIVLTNRDKECYSKRLQNKVICIYNFTTLSIPTEIPERNKVVLTVGRLEPQKGYDLLLPIWKSVVEHVSGWRLLIVGNGKMEHMLNDMIQELELSGNTEIIPATPLIADYFKSSGLYVMSSRFEGLPMVLIEAKMNGLPIVSFDCPNGPSEIIKDGVDGYVVPMDNKELLGMKLVELMQNKEKRADFSRLSTEDAVARFSVSAVMAQWKELFDNIL